MPGTKSESVLGRGLFGVGACCRKAQSWPGKPHPGDCGDKGGQSGKGKREEGESRAAGREGSRGLGKGRRSKRERDKPSPLRGTAQDSPDRLEVSFPVTSV